jgi:uncharacterized protein YecE (DUF72 family)
MLELHPHLHVGTSSFSSTDWIGSFYPPETRPTDFLSYYATKFDCVEIDATYYRAPTLQMTARWAEVTPPHFRFSLKVPKIITHDKALSLAEKEWAQFLRVVDPLGEKLAFLVLQFPYWNRKSEIPDLATFIQRLDMFVQRSKCPYRLVVETRNPKWIGKELLDFLRSRHLILALQDQQWMPRPRELWDKWDVRLKTGESVYVRMLGERERIEKLIAKRKAIEEKEKKPVTPEWSKIVIDRTEETKEWLPIIKSFLAQSAEVDLYYNNHYAGFGPASIELLTMLFRASPA